MCAYREIPQRFDSLATHATIMSMCRLTTFGLPFRCLCRGRDEVEQRWNDLVKDTTSNNGGTNGNAEQPLSATATVLFQQATPVTPTVAPASAGPSPLMTEQLTPRIPAAVAEQVQSTYPIRICACSHLVFLHSLDRINNT